MIRRNITQITRTALWIILLLSAVLSAACDDPATTITSVFKNRAQHTFEVGEINPDTAEVTILGTFTGVQSLTGGAILGEDGQSLYVRGTDADQRERVFEYDLDGATVQSYVWDADQYGHNFTIAAVSPAKRLVGVIQTAGVWQIISMNLPTGEVEILGDVAQMSSWSGVTVMHPSGGLLYLQGIAVGAQDPLDRVIYRFDLNTGEVTSLAVDAQPGWRNLRLAGFDARGRLIALNWSQISEHEQVLHIDEITAEVTVLGTMGGLRWWESQLAISPDGETLFAFGNPSDEGDPDEMYSFDLEHDQYANTVVQDAAHPSPTVAGCRTAVP